MFLGVHESSREVEIRATLKITIILVNLKHHKIEAE